MKNFVIILIILILCRFSLAQTDYEELHRQAIVVDMHTDVVLQILRGADISQRLDYGHVDLIRLKEGGVDVQFFAIWPNPNLYQPDQMYAHSLNMIDRLENVLNNNPDKILLTRSVPEIETAIDAGKIAACLGVEGGTAIEDDLDKLQNFYDRGVRYLGLTWEDSPSWATSAKDETNDSTGVRKGLNAFGKEVIKKMNNLGMLVDLSHSGEQTFWDVLEICTKPPIASHSGVHRLRWHYRNLTDEQIKALAAKGGVLFINFYPGYLDYNFAVKYEAMRKASTADVDSLKKLYGDDRLLYRKHRNEYYRLKAEPFLPDIGRIVDHIDAVVQLVGDDYVGLGSDFDGISITPRGIAHAGEMPNITREMLNRGYSEERIRKILGGNFMRVFKENMNQTK
jgi:membrane dipeptidase